MGAEFPEQRLLECFRFLECFGIRVAGDVACVRQFHWQYGFHKQFDSQRNLRWLNRYIRIDGYIHDSKPECSVAAAACDEQIGRASCRERV